MLRDESSQPFAQIEKKVSSKNLCFTESLQPPIATQSVSAFHGLNWEGLAEVPIIIPLNHSGTLRGSSVFFDHFELTQSIHGVSRFQGGKKLASQNKTMRSTTETLRKLNKKCLFLCRKSRIF